MVAFLKRLVLVLGFFVSTHIFASPQAVMQHWMQAEDCLRSGHLEEALIKYSSAIDLCEQSQGSAQYDMYNDRAYASFLLQKYEQAIVDYSIVIERVNFNDELGIRHLIRALNGRAEAYVRLQLFREAFLDLQDVATIQHMCESRPLIQLAHYSENEIQTQKDASKRELQEANNHLYEMAKEAMNFNAGDVADHAIQAGTHVWKAWECQREVSRMERENQMETSGTWDHDRSFSPGSRE